MFSRTWRRTIAGLMAAVLLGAQALTAAYACPQAPRAMPEEARVLPCHESPGQMDPAQPLLCKAHCAGEQSTRDGGVNLPSPLPPACVDALWVRAIGLAAAEATTPVSIAALSPGPPRGAPPLYLALLVLRN